MFKAQLKLNELAQIAQIGDEREFVSRVQSIERRIRDEVWMVPIAHFPGVVAEAPNFERDEDLAGSWGIQTWAYRVR